MVNASSQKLFQRLWGITQQMTYKLQLIQNFITLIVIERRKFDHIILVLKESGCDSQMFAWLLWRPEAVGLAGKLLLESDVHKVIGQDIMRT